MTNFPFFSQIWLGKHLKAFERLSIDFVLRCQDLKQILYAQTMLACLGACACTCRILAVLSAKILQNASRRADVRRTCKYAYPYRYTYPYSATVLVYMNE
jgi:hypothetical protein